MQVILLAAGQSTRLKPISDKNTLEFNGKALIEHQVAALKAAKMRDIVVVGGEHNLEKLKSILKPYKNVVVVEQKNLKEGMAGGVLAGAAKVGHKNIMVMSTNDVVDPSVFEQAIAGAKGDVDGAIVGAKVESYFPGGYLKFDKNKMLTDIVEKPGEGKEPSNWVNIVLHIYNDFPAFTDRLKKDKSKADGRYEHALDEYIKKGKAKMAVVKYAGYWQPIKYPWHVLNVMAHYFDNQEPKIDKSAEISKTAVIEGNVVIGPKVKVYNNAHIKGPAYIGEGCVIGNNALIIESMLGNNCVIGYSSEVTRSYLNHDVWTHGTYVGDSIIDENVSFGSGTVLANLRFDEANVKVDIKGDRTDTGTHKFGAVIGSGARFGVNSSVNPGMKIGANSFVGSGVSVDKDIEEGKMVLLKQSWTVTKNNKMANTDSREKLK